MHIRASLVGFLSRDYNLCCKCVEVKIQPINIISHAKCSYLVPLIASGLSVHVRYLSRYSIYTPDIFTIMMSSLTGDNVKPCDVITITSATPISSLQYLHKVYFLYSNSIVIGLSSIHRDIDDYITESLADLACFCWLTRTLAD